jgi:DNA protecting protein DprA
MLFVRGSAEALSPNNNVAVVGTRDATPTGERVAVLISKWLGENKWGIVSGLAKGIDTAAHKGALEVGARTVAVMATPLDKVYPAENRALAHQILDAGGCWVSELPLWSKFFRGAFVQRDRIQSGMSVAVIPVQTDVEGGTMHTVRYAEQQKRMLLCPRPIGPEQTLKQYAGVKHLIETHRATAFSAEQYPEIMDSLGKRLAILLKDWTPHPDVNPKSVFIDPYVASRSETIEEENPKPKTKAKKGKPPQIAFGFVQDNSERPRRKSSKEKQQTDAKLVLLEELKDEIEQAKLHHGRDLNDAEIRELIEAKIRILRSTLT